MFYLTKGTAFTLRWKICSRKQNKTKKCYRNIQKTLNPKNLREIQHQFFSLNSSSCVIRNKLKDQNKKSKNMEKFWNFFAWLQGVSLTPLTFLLPTLRMGCRNISKNLGLITGENLNTVFENENVILLSLLFTIF